MSPDLDLDLKTCLSSQKREWTGCPAASGLPSSGWRRCLKSSTSIARRQRSGM
jgi:hypothetical protein